MSDQTKAGLNETFKYVEETKLKHLVPNSSILQRMFPMKENDMLGRQALLPVVLSNELGITFGDDTSFSYNTAVAAEYDEIEIDSSPVILRSRVNLKAMNRMKNNKKARENQITLRAGTMKKSLEKIAEITCIHGGSGIGTISGVSDSSGTNVLTISAATWAPGVWSGMIGLRLDAVDSIGGTVQNSNATLVVSAVDYANKTVTVTGNATDTAALAINDILVLRGADGVEQTGLIAQLDNAGTLFGIDANAYDMWKASEFSVSGALTFAKIMEGVSLAVAKGGLDEDAVFFVSPKNFESMNSDQAAAREYDSSYKKESENGFSSIKFRGQSGIVEVVAHPFFKDGEAALLPKSCVRRIGATDVEFINDGGDYFRAVDGAGAYECVGQFDFQIVITEPAKCVLYKAIS